MSPRHAADPAPEERAAVVTGLGPTTSLGSDVPSTWRALLDGVCGVERVDFGGPEGPAQVYALRDRTAPPACSLERVDPEIGLNVVGRDPAALPSGRPLAAVTTSMGFGGHNVALAFADFADFAGES
ncbi:hypothetical protein [Streptomyces sp. NPDC060275]|uniref:hypothetical protein n=1 Tax=Streptomyces sp. NPDC060275 TaxID=3347090 RepID=UPI0036679E13